MSSKLRDFDCVTEANGFHPEEVEAAQAIVKAFERPAFVEDVFAWVQAFAGMANHLYKATEDRASVPLEVRQSLAQSACRGWECANRMEIQHSLDRDGWRVQDAMAAYPDGLLYRGHEYVIGEVE